MNAEKIKALADEAIRSAVRAKSRYGNEFEIADQAEADRFSLFAAIDELQSERDSLAKDAARYRYLRQDSTAFDECVSELAGHWPRTLDEADAAIDAAIDNVKLTG
jgi:uncharacterized membrane protein